MDDDGSFVGQQFITIDSTSSTILQLDDNVFDSVDQVVFVSSGGTLNTDYTAQVGGAPDTTHLYIDDLVTSSEMRSAGCGGQLLEWVENLARRRGIRRLRLDSGVQRHAAHRFYLRQHFEITCHHFSKGL